MMYGQIVRYFSYELHTINSMSIIGQCQRNMLCVILIPMKLDWNTCHVFQVNMFSNRSLLEPSVNIKFSTT